MGNTKTYKRVETVDPAKVYARLVEEYDYIGHAGHNAVVFFDEHDTIYARATVGAHNYYITCYNNASDHMFNHICKTVRNYDYGEEVKVLMRI